MSWELNGNCPLASVNSLIVPGKLALVVVNVDLSAADSPTRGACPDLSRKSNNVRCDGVIWKRLGSLSRFTKLVCFWVRASNAPKKKVLSDLILPPSEPPNCCRLNGDLPFGAKSNAFR